MENMDNKWIAEIDRLRTENEKLATMLGTMLFLFDRDLPPKSIGRQVCDEAIAVRVRCEK